MLSKLTVLRWITCPVVLTVLAANIGCQSSGSRWARYNPWSSGPDSTALAEAEPKMPTEGSTPQIETLDAPTTAVASAASVAPTFEPSTTPPTAPGVKTPSLPAGTTPSPTTQLAQSATPSPSAGPYDPNAFRENDPADNAIAAVASNLRAGAEHAKQSVAQSASSLGNRYANVASPQADDLPDFSFADAAAPAAVGGRYASTAATPAASTPVASTSAPTTPTPTTPATNPLAAPSYPVATTPIAATPVAPAPATQPAATPAPAVQPAGGAIASTTRVELTAGPGEYRPAGTGSYLGSVNVASRPQPQAQPTGSAYPTTGQQYR